MQMGRAGKLQHALDLEFLQQEEQRDRIRPAGEPDEHAVAVAQQRVTANGLERAGSEWRHGQLVRTNAEWRK